MKYQALNIRIPESQKTQLISDSLSLKISISNLTRDILTNYFEEQNNGDTIENYLKEIDNTIYNSNQFIFLVSWLFERKNQPYDSCEKRILEQLKQTTFSVIKSDNIPKEIKTEFEKVYVDLSRYILQYGTQNNHFRFCTPNENGSFNYNLFSDFIQKKTFENAITI